jgi:hypothetical protein
LMAGAAHDAISETAIVSRQTDTLLPLSCDTVFLHTANKEQNNPNKTLVRPQSYIRRETDTFLPLSCDTVFLHTANQVQNKITNKTLVRPQSYIRRETDTFLPLSCDTVFLPVHTAN